MKNFYLILLLVVTNLFSSRAQKSVTHQQLYWVRLATQWTLNPQWVWQNEIEDRRFFNHHRQHHLIMHSHLHRKLSPNADVAMGLTYSQQSPQFVDAPESLVVPEIRPFQEVNYSSQLSPKVTLSQRFRLDERFIHNSNATELLPGYSFNWRFRYRLQAACQLSSTSAKHPVVGKISDEIMLNAGKHIVYNFFDQNRIGGFVEVEITKHFSVEAGYLHWFQQRSSGNEFFSRDILRLTANVKW